MTALTRCPIDGSRIVRNHEGDIECSVAIIGNHSQAVMLRAYATIHVEASVSPVSAAGLGEPCLTCGKPKRAVTRPKRDAPPFAYCEPCRSANGHTANMPSFSLTGPRPLGYYDDTGRTTR